MHPTFRTFVHTSTLTALLLAMLFGLAACASSTTRTDSLYVALGEAEGTARLVDALVERLYTDARIAFLFKDVERDNLKRLIREQFCAEAGGPCEYSGRSMSETHSGLGLQAKEFDAFVENFIDAMEDVQLPYRTQNRMLRIFAPMRADIIDQ